MLKLQKFSTHPVVNRESGCVHEDGGHDDGGEGPGRESNDRRDEGRSVLGRTNWVADSEEPTKKKNRDIYRYIYMYTAR